MFWHSHLFQNFSQFIVIYIVNGFGIVSKAEIDVLFFVFLCFFFFSLFFHDPADVGSLVSGSSAFSKTSLNIWRFTVHVLLKPGLEVKIQNFCLPGILLNQSHCACLVRAGWFSGTVAWLSSHWEWLLLYLKRKII